MAKLDGHTSGLWSVVALQDDTRALSGGFDKTLRLWDLASRSCLKTIQRGTDDTDHVFGSAVNRAANQALSGHRTGRVRLWSLETGECLATLKGHSADVNSVRTTPDGRKDKKSRQVIFEGENLDMEAVWQVRDAFFPPTRRKSRNG